MRAPISRYLARCLDINRPVVRFEQRHERRITDDAEKRGAKRVLNEVLNVEYVTGFCWPGKSTDFTP